MGEFEKCFIYFIFGTFCSTFSRIYGLNVKIYTPILILCFGVVLWWFLQDFRPFDPAIDPHLSDYWPTTEVSQVLCPRSKRIAEDFIISQNHGLTIVSPMDHGELVTANLFILICCAAENDPFGAYKACFLAKESRIMHPSPSHYYSHIHLSFIRV